MSAEICPRCCQPRAWVGWRQCPCGYDFGPQFRRIPATPPPLPTRAGLLQQKRDRAFTAGVLLSIGAILLFGTIFFVAVRLPHSPNLVFFIERSWGPILPVELHVRNLDSTEPETVMSALYFLERRKSAAGAERAVELLASTDDYIWLNAADYAGSCGRQEAVPYLIKGLRHTAWRSVPERAGLLRELTGKSYPTDFAVWHNWWTTENPHSQMDWESHLGHAPRLTPNPQ